MGGSQKVDVPSVQTDNLEFQSDRIGGAIHQSDWPLMPHEEQPWVNGKLTTLCLESSDYRKASGTTNFLYQKCQKCHCSPIFLFIKD